MHEDACVGEGHPQLPTAKLRLLASEVVRAEADTGWVPDVRDAIQLATELLVAGTDGPATMEVALLDPGASFEQSRQSVCAMLVEHGFDMSALSDADVYGFELDAFAAGLVDAHAIEGRFYDQLSASGPLTPLDRALVRLFDEREGLPDFQSRAVIETNMREVIREARRL